jgi:asparagine synthase (glutamine-hydrolysing)
MCGITGWYDPADVGADRQRRLLRMCDAIRHRGPDDEGQIVDGAVALGVRRLSIIDIAGGHQPMTSADGRVSIVFNGEIYNHQELRQALKAKGRAFQTTSDTEVVLALYEREGLDCVHKLNGMFAIAIHDRTSGELHLIRDRLGVKPLYYHLAGNRLTFGSEIKAILAGLDRIPDVDPQAIWDYLTFRFVPSPGTIWRDIAKLPPAHRLTIGPRHAAPKIERYWDIPAGAPRWKERDADIIARFGELLRDAVHLRMLADVPVGILLSGGLDSSVVAAMAARESGRLTTFSVGFRDRPDIDETPYARMMSQHLGTNHSEVFIGIDEFRDFLPELVYYTDEPLADLASIPLHYVCKLARRDVKVVLSGEGSDEILGGYSFDVWAKRWDEARAAQTGWRYRLPGTIGRMFFPGSEPDAIDLDLRRTATPLTMTNYLTSEEKRRMLLASPPWPDSLDHTRAGLQRIGKADTLDQALYTYCQDWLVEDLLMKADKMSMANSLELRTPFLDYRLVEFTARMPARLKVGKDQDDTYRTKLALRYTARNFVPPAIIDRPKLGFPVPAYDWLSGELQGWAREILLDPSARLGNWFDKRALGETVAAGTDMNAQMTERHRLWNFLILEIWLQRWLSANGSSPSPG